MRTKHPYPYSWRAVRTPEGWEVWCYNEGFAEHCEIPKWPDGSLLTEEEARREASQLNTEYELHNTPTP